MVKECDELYRHRSTMNYIDDQRMPKRMPHVLPKMLPKALPILSDVSSKSKKKRINLLYSFSPYRLISSLSFYRLSAFHHNQADLKRFMHMRQPLRNYFGSDLLNTIEDMFSLFGGNLHGGVIRGRWCLKLVFV